MRWLLTVLFVSLIGCGPASEGKEDGDFTVQLPDGGTMRGSYGYGLVTPMKSGDPNGVSSIRAEFPEVDIYTLQFSIDPIAQNPLAYSPCEALILWSINGVQNKRRVTVASGVSVSGSAESVTVQLFDKATSVGPNYNVYVTVARGARPGLTNPPALYLFNGTTLIFTVAGGASLDIPVPQGVGANSFMIQGDESLIAANQLIATPLNQVGGGAIGSGFDVLAGNLSWIPLAPGAGALHINNTGAGGVSFMVILGIDG